MAARVNLFYRHTCICLTTFIEAYLHFTRFENNLKKENEIIADKGR